jgi:spore maturation protein CgeB
VSGHLRFRYFAHSWISDWNHGNAHFLRGLARELQRQGHEVRCYEQFGSWSLTSLVVNEGEKAQQAIEQFRREFPDLDVRLYEKDSNLADTLKLELKGADIVVIHEWNDPEVVNTILALKRELGFAVLLHDTHHRAYTNPGELLRFQLQLFDGVLAFGEAIRRIYVEGFGIERAWTFHEAADIGHFAPRQENHAFDLLWIGNWGDEERTRELKEFLIEPAAELRPLKTVVYGVRYPDEGKSALADAGIEFRGYISNLMAPEAYAKSALSLHIPRCLYANGLGGIPTIRVFEALACGAPLLCAPWEDAEHLFRPGEDFVITQSGQEMKQAIQWLLRDATARRQIAANGRETILRRHTCGHRAAQLVEICGELMQ